MDIEFSDQSQYGSFIPVSRISNKAGIAQLVEHNLAKVGVASSSLVSRSSLIQVFLK